MRLPVGLFAVVSIAGCSPDARRGPPSLGIEVLAAAEGVGGARQLRVHADRPVTVEVDLFDGAEWRALRFAGRSEQALLPILGLHPSAEAVVEVRATDGQGRTASETLAFASDPLPERFPDIEVLARDPERVEPGYFLLVVRSPGGGASPLVVLDDEARPVWWADLRPQFGGDVRRSDAGTFIGLADGGWQEVDVFGELLRAVHVDGEPLSHEVVAMPDGTFWGLRPASFEEPAYPVDPLDPLGPTAPAVIADREVLHFDADGAVLTSWRLSERLDTTRVSDSSFHPIPYGLDWAHTNAVLPTEDGGAIVSVRHQDAVIRLEPDGSLRWILGDPAGWRSPWRELVLDGTPELGWQYHQHAPALAPDGTLVVYDNHNRGSTLYEPPPDEAPHSRALAFRIDEEARTVASAWERAETTAGTVYTPANGDVDHLPATGNWFVDFGFVTYEDGVANEELGLGARSVRLVEWALDRTDPVFEVRLSSTLEDEPEGWQAFRAERIPALYPPGWLEEEEQ